MPCSRASIIYTIWWPKNSFKVNICLTCRGRTKSRSSISNVWYFSHLNKGMSYGPRDKINDLLPRKRRDFNGIKGSFIHDWLDFIVWVRTIINALSVFIPRAKRSSSTHEKQRGWQREEAKKGIGIVYLPLLLSWARIRSDTTEPICLECEIHLIGSAGLFQSHESKRLIFAVSIPLVIHTLSQSPCWLHWPISLPSIEVRYKWNNGALLQCYSKKNRNVTSALYVYFSSQCCCWLQCDL